MVKAKSFVCGIKHRSRVRRIIFQFDMVFFLFLKFAKTCLDSLDWCDVVGDFTWKFPSEILVGFRHFWMSFSFGCNISK